jgi:hypothetical protein
MQRFSATLMDLAGCIVREKKFIDLFLCFLTIALIIEVFFEPVGYILI